MAPIVHGLEVEYAGDVNFVYLDIDDQLTEQFKRDLGYRYQPHYFLINGQGEIIEQWLGYVNADVFRAAFDSQLGE